VVRFEESLNVISWKKPRKIEHEDLTLNVVSSSNVIWCHFLNVNAEKLMATLVLLSFALTSVLVFFGPRRLLKREEAIEISRNSELVQSRLKNSDNHMLEVGYQNMTGVNDHGMWIITWYIHRVDEDWFTVVFHKVDEVTGEILVEGTSATG